MDHAINHHDDDLSENWQRFMILWSSTPEFFIGSCIICMAAVLYAYFVTRKDDDRQCGDHIRSMEGPNGPDKTADSCYGQLVIRNENARSRKAKRNGLRNRKKNRGALSELVPDPSLSDEETFEEDSGQISPYKKSRYRMAAEKLASSLSDVQLQEEREIQREQLKAIFDMMKDKQDVYGIQDLSQVEEQLKYYG